MGSHMFTIPKLSGRDNFTTWKFAMEAYLQHEELWDCVTGNCDDTKKDTKAKSKIILLIDPQLFVHVQNCETSKQVWDKLKKAFEDSGLLRKVGLLRELINTSLQTCSSVEEYVNKLMTSAHKLREIKFPVDDEWLGTLMLAGLPEEYRPMIMAIESSGITISADLIKTKLLQEIKQDTTNAFYTNLRKPKKGGPRCFVCNKYGHISKNCWFKNKKCEDDGENNGFVAAFSANSVNDESSWFVDSGASAHMTMHQGWLENETTPPVQNIRIANNKILSVKSCGNVVIKVLNESTGQLDSIQLKNVLYVPELSTNLLSVSQIVKNECKIQFSVDGCKIWNKNGKQVAKASLTNNTYKLKTYRGEIAMTAKTESTHLWHQRMGHLNIEDVKKIEKCAVGVKLSSEKEKIICTPCFEGKQTRKPFNNEGTRATELLSRINSDICGPFESKSLGGARYFLTFIDDFSRKVFVYFLRQKSEALEKFIEFKNRVENELNMKIKVLKTDNGGEYINKNFETCLKQFGIQHQTSNPYTPEQNGLSERMNRTLIERAKCMLFNASLQKEYWAEAVATAAYIINRSPTRALGDITPEQMWSGAKPDLSHMKIFGCKAMVHVPKEKRQKLDPKSQELIFIGYSEGRKGYRLADIKTKQIILSRDVIFLESSITQKNDVKSRLTNNHLKNNEKIEEAFLQENESADIHNNIRLSLSNAEEQDSAHSLEIYEEASIDDDYTSYENANDETYSPECDETLSPPNTVILTRNRRRNITPVHDYMEHLSYLSMNVESATSLLDNDPQNHIQALNSDEANHWKNAMNEEYQSLIENNTWTVTNLPEEKKVIPCKWVFKTKRDEVGNIVRYKARLVIKGYRQTKGIDYHEVYAPVVRYTSVRYLMGLAVKHKLQIHQMDAITAFLQGDVDEEIYMSPPPCYEIENKVCRLNKSLYGLKQASRQWNKKLNTTLLEIGMSRSKIDPCIYYRILNDKDILFITVYVDDLLCFFNNESTALHVKQQLSQKFKMKDMGPAKHCIGIKITQEESLQKITLDQSVYIRKILNRFQMNESKPVPTPFEAGTQLKKATNNNEVLKDIPYQEAVGCLLYLSQCTRPDISYAVSTVSRYNNEPTMQHWVAVKRIFRYLSGTVNMKITFKNHKDGITGYCDADWASDSEDRRSCTGYLFLFQGAAISWNSKKQPTIALSSSEAEYMSLSTATQEALWLKQLVEEFWPSLSGTPLTVYCDNQSAISLAGTDGYNARSKHIDVRVHFLREKLAAGQIKVLYKSTEHMVADALTKGLPKPRHQMLTAAMGLRSGEDVA